ncbi:hypothetical protein GQ53DRAFT_706435 [Thozetella sp. PMI_491]|nr:hypothetical protein GQ53DRAFT_706435 [Thozetella sp. PMI_491]
MVSQPDPSTSLTLRGPASVVGVGSSHNAHHGHSQSHRAASHVSSRARRYNRSHAGGASYVPQNEFPVFTNSGDVEIIVRVASGHENRYLLHRHTLTRCSGFFEASTSNEWSRAQPMPALPSSGGPVAAIENGGSSRSSTDQPRTGGELARVEDSDGANKVSPLNLTPAKKRWRYELDPGTGENDVPMLVQKEEESPNGAAKVSSSSIFGGGPPPSARHHKTSSSTHGGHSFFRSVANLGFTHTPALPPPTPAEQDLLRDYDNLFRIMYNYPPILDGINIADAYVQCKLLLNLADQYDALAVVGPRVDHHMLQFQSRLWKQIAKYPISYLRLGYLARSKIIFQEALIHVVGQWPTGERNLRAALPEAVIDIIEDKVDELEETVSRVESRLFRLTLTNRNGERVTPGTSYLDWLAVSLFRQWLAENTTPPGPPVPERRGQSLPSSSRQRGQSSGSTSDGSAAGAPRTGGGGGPSGRGAGAVLALPPLASLGRTYRTLGSAATAAYLGHDECKRFLKLTPDLYSRDNLRRFEKRIDELKAMAREVVRPLMGSGLELDLGASGSAGVGYLTCTSVGDRDLPWAVYD